MHTTKTLRYNDRMTLHHQKGQAIVWIIIIAALILASIVAFFLFSRDTTTPTDNPTGGQTIDSPDGAATSTGKVSEIKIFFYAPNDNGAHGKLIGCGDSVMPIPKSIAPTSAPLTAALKELFAEKSQTLGESGFMNALYQSDLVLKSAAVKDGKATVKITGVVRLSGVCDEPRFMAQIEETIKQFPTVSSTEIFINDQPMQAYLSQKGL